MWLKRHSWTWTVLICYWICFKKCYPGESNTSNSSWQHVSQDAGEGVACWEVGVEPGMLPVRHPHHDLVLHVLHDILPGLGVVRGWGRDEVTEVSRLYCWSHASTFYLLMINFSHNPSPKSKSKVLSPKSKSKVRISLKLKSRVKVKFFYSELWQSQV